MADRTKFVTPEATLMWAHIFKPKQQKRGDPMFQCDLVFSPAAMETPEFAALKAEAQRVAIEKFGDKLKALIEADKFISPFWPNKRKLNVETGKLPDGYEEGGCYITIKSSMRPGVGKLSPQGPVPVIDENEIYPGCIARASVHCWPYDNESKGVSFGLNSLLKIREGTRLGGGSGDVKNDFGDWAKSNPAAAAAPAEDIFGKGGVL